METVATVRVPRAIVSLTVAARSSLKRSVSAWRAVSAPAVIDGRPRTGATAADGTTAGAGGTAAAPAGAAAPGGGGGGGGRPGGGGGPGGGRGGGAGGGGGGGGGAGRVGAGGAGPGAGGGGPAATACAALGRPPVAALSASAGVGSTFCSSVAFNWEAVSAGLTARISASAPLTCGAAIEVPSSAAKHGGGVGAQRLLMNVEMMFTPGANRSTLSSPKFEKGAGASLSSEAPTQITFASGSAHG